MQYPTYAETLELHSEILKHSMGLDGVLDEALLASCLDWIQNDDFYPSLNEKVAHLVFSIAMNHIFADGNKRTAIMAGAYLMYKNNLPEDCVLGFPRYMENVVLRLAKKEISKAELLEMISGYIGSF